MVRCTKCPHCCEWLQEWVDNLVINRPNRTEQAEQKCCLQNRTYVFIWCVSCIDSCRYIISLVCRCVFVSLALIYVSFWGCCRFWLHHLTQVPEHVLSDQKKKHELFTRAGSFFPSAPPHHPTRFSLVLSESIARAEGNWHWYWTV